MAAASAQPPFSPKSPSPVSSSSIKGKEDKVWFRLGAVGRKKKIKGVNSLEYDGGRDSPLDSPSSDTSFDISILERELDDGEERCLVDRRMLGDEKLRLLTNSLIDWINDELAEYRIIIKSLEDDLYDGQVLHRLLEKLTGKKLELPEVSVREENQREKLDLILRKTNEIFGLEFPSWTQEKWNVDTLHSKSLISILHLLVYLATHFKAPIRIPENVTVEMLVVKKRGGKLEQRRVLEEITRGRDETDFNPPDALDGLLSQSQLPEKLEIIKKRLLTFTNKQLGKISLQAGDLETEFHDGVYLILLMGLLEGYFVPLHAYYLTPKDTEQKLSNVRFCFDLMRDAGFDTSKIRPEDIVNMEPRATLRLLCTLLLRYKDH